MTAKSLEFSAFFSYIMVATLCSDPPVSGAGSFDQNRDGVIGMTEFSNQFQDYLIHTKNASENTVASYKRDIRQFIAYLAQYEPLELSGVQRSHICDYITWM